MTKSAKRAPASDPRTWDRPDAPGARDRLQEDLLALAAVYGPSGRESAIAAEIASRIGPLVGETRRDALGNLIATREPDRRSATRRRLMLCAHMDQAGLVVTDVTKEGFLRFSVAGVLAAASLVGQPVRNHEGVPGIVALEDGVEPKDLGAQTMVIDVGATDPEAVRERKVALGDVFCPQADPLDLGGRVSVPALDDRAGCAVLLEVARRLEGGGCRHEVAFVFTVQGAIAPRGAGPAAYLLQPDLALAVDVTPARGPGKTPSNVELGRGPAIRVKDRSHVTPVRVRDHLLQAAAAAQLPHQLEVTSAEEVFSDARVIQLAGAGVPAGTVGLPVRFYGTPAALLDLDDLEAAASLVTTVASGSLEL